MDQCLVWADEFNKSQIEKQRDEYTQLKPHLKEDEKFKINKSNLIITNG